MENTKGIPVDHYDNLSDKLAYPDFFHLDKQKYRCIKSHDCYGNPCFIEGQIYECSRAIMQSMAYCTEEYKAKYQYPHQSPFSHEEFTQHFRHLSEERNGKIDTILTGITIEEQMKKAEEILQTKVIPRNKEYQKRKNERNI